MQFYEALFRRAPHLKPMFREDLGGQGMRFMATLGAIVDNLHRPEHRPEAMADRYTDLGAGHRAIGVTARDFEPMGKALLDTLEETLGDAFTPEKREAWALAFAEFSHDIIERGEIPPE